jgi:YggT family protein
MNIFVLIRTVEVFFTVLYVVLFLRVILSWFPIKNNRLLDLLYSITEPILAPIRKLVSRSPLGGPGMVLDFSPLIAFVLLQLIQGIIQNYLYSLLL